VSANKLQARKESFRLEVSDWTPTRPSTPHDSAPSLSSRRSEGKAPKTWQLTRGEWRPTKTSKFNLSPYPFKKIPAPSKVEKNARDMAKKYADEIQAIGRWATETSDDGRLRAMNYGYLIRKHDGKQIPVTAIRCDPNNLDAYAARIARTKGLVIAINADATEIPGTYLCYAHKETPELGNKGQAAVLRKKGGKSLPKTFRTAIKRKFGKILPKSEVVAVKINDMDRGQLKCEGLLAINGPRLAKGQRTETDHVDQLGEAFDHAAQYASDAGVRKVTYTGISTGRFNFDPVAGGVTAIDCMITALVEGALDQAVGAFWCGGKDNKVLAGSAAEGALASLLCSAEFHLSGKVADMATESSSEESSDNRRIKGAQDPWDDY
jgi:O-acetyl-ADP-ribose deacetylase (regulator of RNase III)